MESNGISWSMDDEALSKIVRQQSETDGLDFKGPIVWDGGQTSAELAKDIVAFANSRGGGVIVIGVSESTAGCFDRVGLSPDQARTFDTTDIGKWISSRFSPSIAIACFHTTVDGKQFVVIQVQEFDDIPIICIKDFQIPDSTKLVLRKGTIYTRNQNSESTSLQTADELRRLIGLATAKRADELVARIRAVIVGEPKQPPDAVPSPAMVEAKKISAFLQSVEPQGKGLWTAQFAPKTTTPELFLETRAAREVLSRIQSRWFGLSFPRTIDDLHRQEWGVAFNDESEGFGLSTHGAFGGFRVRHEESMDYESPWKPVGRPPSENTHRSPGTWIEFQWTIAEVVQRFRLFGALAAVFEPQVPIDVIVGATNLSGRMLVSQTATVTLMHVEPCRAPSYEWSKSNVLAAELQAGWQDYCEDALFRLMLLLNVEGITRETIRSHMGKIIKGVVTGG